MEISTLTALLTAIMLLAPGYIFNRTKRRYAVFQEEPDWQHALLSYLVHSLVLLSIAWPVLAWMGRRPESLLDTDSASAIARQLIASPKQWGLTVIVFPVVAGWLAALAVRFNLIDIPARIARRLGGGSKTNKSLKPLPSIVQGWSAVYLQLTQRGPHVVMVVLKNRSTVVGIFGSGSATTRSGAYPDLFLSQLCDTPATGDPIPVPGSRGVFIRGSEIAMVQLYAKDDQEPRNVEEPAVGSARHDQG